MVDFKNYVRFLGHPIDPNKKITGKFLGFYLNSRSGVIPRLSVDESEVERLIAARVTARADKDWAEADRLRDQPFHGCQVELLIGVLRLELCSSNTDVLHQVVPSLTFLLLSLPCPAAVPGRTTHRFDIAPVDGGHAERANITQVRDGR